MPTNDEAYTGVPNSFGDGRARIQVTHYTTSPIAFSWESPVSFTVAGSDFLGTCDFVIYHFAKFTDPYYQRQQASGFLTPKTVTISGPQPEPSPPGGAVPGKNNSGNMCPVPSPEGAPKMSMPITGPQMSIPVGKPVLSFVGDPINAGTGNLFETQTDFTAASNTQLSFTRYYNSYDQSIAGLGIGWHSTIIVA